MKNILYHVIKRLDTVFGVPIYTVESEQKRPTPSINLMVRDMRVRRELRGRLWLDIGVTATYLPPKKSSQYDLETTKLKMAFALDRIPTEGVQFIQAVTNDVQEYDGTVQGLASYSIYIKQGKTVEQYMQTLGIDFTTTPDTFQIGAGDSIPNVLEKAEPLEPGVAYFEEAKNGDEKN